MAERLAQIARVDGLAMIQIRADLQRAGDAIAEAVGLAIPEVTRMVTDGSRHLGWMSPDELLLILPSAQLPEAMTEIAEALTGEHSLIADMSDARVVFEVTGPHATDVLAKLTPVDVVSMLPDEFRRSRVAQIGVAFWRVTDGYRVIGFGSTAEYLQQILQNAAIPGSQLAPR